MSVHALAAKAFEHAHLLSDQTFVTLMDELRKRHADRSPLADSDIVRKCLQLHPFLVCNEEEELIVDPDVEGLGAHVCRNVHDVEQDDGDGEETRCSPLRACCVRMRRFLVCSPFDYCCFVGFSLIFLTLIGFIVYMFIKDRIQAEMQPLTNSTQPV